MLDGCVEASVTVIVADAVLLPSAVVTVIFAVPAALAVTVPLDTVATDVFDEDHVTFLFVAFEGEIVAVNVVVLPTSKVALVLFKDTPVTATVVDEGCVTLTVAVALYEPSCVVTVIVAVPAALAVFD